MRIRTNRILHSSVLSLILFCMAVGTLSTSCEAKVKRYSLEVVAKYFHDEKSYTQGLFFHDGVMYESTGQWGESTLRTVDLTTGKPIINQNFPKKYFLEGSCIFDGKLYLLTWTNKLAFVYDPQTLEYRRTLSYPREGWGLTTDGKQLIASDGSANLYFLDGDLKEKKRVTVKLNGRPLKYLNELEWIDGKVWANVYTTDLIAIIDPSTGNVEATVDCTGLLPKELRDNRTDVLNGIAYNPADRKIYLTGKYWKRLYEIRLVEKN